MREKTRVAFIVFGVHKDGLQDPMGTPFIDDVLVARAAAALSAAGLEVVRHEIVLSTKREARDCLQAFRKRDDIQAVILFAGTWVWAAHLVASLREYSQTGRGIVIWTHPGSQGWRPVGGLVLHGGLKEVGIPHRFVYGDAADAASVRAVVSYCRASHLKNTLSMATVGVFGGRGMGQTCGQADGAQWMRVFGIDIDTRDSIALLSRAEAVTPAALAQCRTRIQKHFKDPVPTTASAERSVRLLAAIEAVVAEEAWEAYSIQSYPGIADAFSATCLAQSMMLEWGVPTSTLGDMNTLLSVIALMNLGTERVYYGDLQHIDKASREIKIIGDGACPPSLAGKTGPARFAEHGIPTEGEAGGISVDLVCKEGRGVLARFGRSAGAMEMVLCRCRVFEPSAAEIRRRREECHIPFWPHAFVTAEADMEALVQSWNNEYAVLGYGEDLYGEVSDFCALAGVKLIAL